MKMIKLLALAVAFLLAAPMWATTIYGGFEDTTPGGDHDYNDLVFSMTGNFTVNSATGVWHSPSGLVLGTSGSPFWNNLSSDPPGTGMNIGYCIYGGGACNGGVGLAPGSYYLATPSGGAATDVSFTSTGGLDATIYLTITADTDSLGWALLSSPGTVHLFGSSPGTFSFTPGGAFELIGNVNGSTNYGSDSSSQFAFFSPTPEPSSLMLLGTGLLGMAGVARRRFLHK